MKKSLLLVILIATVSCVGNAQTKKIAYRSHNGTSGNFRNEEEDNFGLSTGYYRIADSIAQKREQEKKDSIAGKQQKKANIKVDSLKRVERKKK